MSIIEDGDSSFGGNGLGSNSLDRYIREVNCKPLFSQEEETRVARLWQETKQERYAKQLVEANLRFVLKITFGYKYYPFPIMDLIQEGNQGLVKAVKTFDPDKDCRLISYAVWWIRAFIHEYILRNWSLVKIGTTQFQRRMFDHLQSPKRRLEIARMSDDLRQQRLMLSIQLGGTVEDVEEMEARLYSQAKSLDAPIKMGVDEGACDSYDIYPSGKKDGAALLEEREEEHNRRKALLAAMSRLCERERNIIIARHLQDRPLTFRELGAQLGISKERVRQLEKRGLAAMREFI